MSDKKIRRYAWIALIVAIALGIWGEVSRVLARSELVKQNCGCGHPDGDDHDRRAQRGRRGIGAARRRAGFYRSADLRAHERLP